MELCQMTITTYSKDVHCDTLKDVKELLMKEKFVVFEITAETAGGFRVDITY